MFLGDLACTSDVCSGRRHGVGRVRRLWARAGGAGRLRAGSQEQGRPNGGLYEVAVSRFTDLPVRRRVRRRTRAEAPGLWGTSVIRSRRKVRAELEAAAGALVGVEWIVEHVLALGIVLFSTMRGSEPFGELGPGPRPALLQ